MTPCENACDLYRRYRKCVYGLALRILGCREDAEDLTHEVFAAVCDSSPCAYDPTRGSVVVYLKTLTRSRGLDRLRRRGRSARLLGVCRDASAITPRPQTPFELTSLRRTAERVRAALAGLPERQRQVMELAYFDGLTQREIAVDLATPVGTIKSLSRRALVRLERALAPAK